MPAARERRQRAASMTLRDYIAALRPTAQALSEAVCAIDLSGCIQFANTRFQNMLARTEPELLGKYIWDFGQCVSVHTPNQPMAGALNQALLDALIQRASQEYSVCEWRRPDGSPTPCLCSLRPIIHDGQALGVMLVSRVTDNLASSGEPTPQGDGHAESQAEALRQALRETVQVERRLRVVEMVGDIALTQLPLDDLLQALLDGIRREMALENVGIFLVNEAGMMVTARVASGAGAEIADSIRVPFGQGIIGESMRVRRPIFIPNVNELVARSEHFTPELRARMNLQSLLMVPLIVEGRPIGAISVGASEPNHFTQEDVRLVELVGEHAALAIERARANDEAERARERLRFLNDASGSLNATLDYHEATRRLADVVTPALADACAIYLLEDDGLLRKVATRSPVLGLAGADPHAAALESLVAGLASTVEVRADDPTCAIGRAVHSLTAVVERASLTEDAGDATLTSICLSVPLVVRQHALGAIYLVGRPGREFSTGDMALIQGLTERAAVAIDNARFYLETQQALAAGSAMATQLDTIFDATDVGIFVTDNHGEFLRINAYGANMLGLAHTHIARSPDQAQPQFELRTPEGDVIPPEREPLYLARALGQPVEQRVVIHRRDTGKDIQALIRCSPWLDVRHHIAGAIGVFTDITVISALERQKDEFLGIASHELKTPLTSLKILAQLLTRKMEASGESRDLEQAKRMQISIKRMESLIRDLLDVSLIQEGKLALNQTLTELGAICADAVSEQKLLTQREIHYSAASDEPLMVYADTERIYQVVTNLLSNALKYSPAMEPVEVRARATASECIVSVQDYGSGVPPEAIDHIFERFFRVPGMQVQTGSGVGLGLGLNLSKDIVSRHGGRIWVESKLGHGSIFSFSLPRADSAPEA